MTSSQKPVDDIICSGVTPFLLFSQYGILYAEHQNIFPFRKLLFYSAQYFPVSEATATLRITPGCCLWFMRYEAQLSCFLPLGKKKSKPTHYHMYQFAQNNTDSDVLQSLSSAKRSPVYHTFAVFCSIKKSRTSSSNRFACGHFATTSSQFSQTVSINFSYVRFSFLGRFLIFTP